MDTKKLIEIPITIVSIIFISGVQGVIKLDPLIVFGLWVYMSIYFIIFMSIKLINGGYKNDFEDKPAFGNDWRPGLIAVILLTAPFFIILSSVLWGNTKSENYWFMTAIVVLDLILCYFSIKFRFKLLKLLSPEEKESPIKFIDLKEHIRWYHWLILLIYLFIAFAYLLIWLGYQVR